MEKNKTLFLIVWLIVIAILVTIILTSCATTTVTVVSRDASEIVGKGLDGKPVIIEEFVLTLEYCVVTYEQDTMTETCHTKEVMVNRDQFNRAVVGEPYRP